METTAQHDKFFNEDADGRPVPDDWCYVYNFEEAHKPNALRLPAGSGHEFQQDMHHLLQGGW